MAQSDPSAGIQPFSTQVNDQYDSIDLASSNIYLSIPILQKNGKFPFSYQLVGNFHVYPVFNNEDFWAVSAGVNSVSKGWGGGLSGVPSAADLGKGQINTLTGNPIIEDVGIWVNYVASYFQCVNPEGTTEYGELDNNFAVVDNTGAVHGVPYLSVQINRSPGTGCGAIVNGSGATTDGSGYQIVATLANSQTSYSVAVY